MYLENLAVSVSITDLTLNDFCIDLTAYMKTYPGVLEQSPTGLFAVVSLDAELHNKSSKTGVVFCLKNTVHTDSNYALAAFNSHNHNDAHIQPHQQLLDKSIPHIVVYKLKNGSFQSKQHSPDHT